MTQQDYDQKKRECFVKFCKDNGIDQEVNISIFDAFDQIFDRAFALGKQEKDGIDLKKLDKKLDDALKKETKESLNQWLSEKDADTVIQGWVARDFDGDVFLYQNEPDRNEIAWNGYMMHSLPVDSFPDLTWESDPIEVEIIIKRKKNG